MDTQLVSTVAALIRCQVGSFPFNYLGIPIGGNPRSVALWKPVVDKFRSKLSIWKNKLLSFNGRLTLLKSVLANLPIYFMFIFRMPASVVAELEKIKTQFLWGDGEDKRKLRLIDWDTICRNRDYRGLETSALACVTKPCFLTGRGDLVKILILS